jgi:predicted dehydrogenase
MSSTTNKTVLIAGCGSIGHRHARLLSERPDVVLWGCDLSKEMLESICSKATIERQFSDHRDALKERPDLVWVCTPEEGHAAIAVDALRAGADVFCEKPLADSIESGQAIVDEVRQTGRTLFVGYVLRCESGINLIKKLMDEKRIGTVISAEASVGDYETLVAYCKTDHVLRGKDTLVRDYSHEIDYLRWFFGEPVEVAAMSDCLGDFEKMPDPNIVEAILRFESGALVRLHLDYMQDPGRRSILLVGDRGRISYTVGDQYVQVQMLGEARPEKIPLTDQRDD